MIKRLLLAALFSIAAVPAFAACSSPVVVKDGAGSNVSMSMATGADANCQSKIDIDTSSQLHADMIAPVPAGTNLIGDVNVRQGGTALSATNGWYGNLLQGNVVLSATNGTFTNVLFNNVAASTGSGVMGTGTQRMALATDSPGIITLGAAAVGSSVPITGNTTPTIANGNGVVNAPSAESLAAITPVVSAALESNHVIKAGAGNFYSGYVTTGATAGWLLLANSTTAPTAGGAAIAPIACVVAPANATTAIGGQIPIRASTGITLVFSSSGCLTNTASATAYFSGLAN